MAPFFYACICRINCFFATLSAGFCQDKIMFIAYTRHMVNKNTQIFCPGKEVH